ncbi:4-hydroxyphenylacetate 3-hydroxylase family protein [Mycobacterium colombiense]|uniref:4-hydroxyphenylacetate 3-hydroxylase family protein n=1 Tax=Mycobacterium colombiense TaxID=339268 RepID=UPI00200A8353|nr:4-hydroxyphenylacetate 3-hydroxylase family protein [Mycobacterium colombiense]MCK8647127.1 4-hydroxyphenylacetate 3-hydroxylase family protein [Mycobacterium colombiense]
MTQLHETPQAVATSRLPMTGDEYLESLRDGREVWLHGERIADVTVHPAFRNTARMVARLYDALHDPAMKNTLTVPTETGNGGFTHPAFTVARTRDDLRRTAKAIEEWARISYGWLGRSPDYKAGFTSSLGAFPELFAPYEANARRWYTEAQERVLFINHAIINPPVDRDQGHGAAEDVCIRVVDETDAGAIVTGAKVVATNAALTHYNLIANYAPVSSKDLSLTFMCPVGTPGVKLICRPSYELNAATIGSPFDYPLSSRFDENDSILVLDRVLVPWENVLAYDVESANTVLYRSGFVHRSLFQGCIRIAVKFDFLVGLLAKGLEMTGTIGFRGVQTRIGELICLRNLFWTCVDSMVENPTTWTDGSLVPNSEAAAVYRLMATQAYPRAKEIFEQDIASALVYLPSSSADWANPDLRPYLDRFVRGSGGRDAVERVKLMKLIWDAIGTEFGGRHELYERNYAGNHESVRMQPFFEQSQSGQIDAYKAMVDRCLAEYDLDGWTAPDLIGNDDVRVIGPGARTRA